jgi:hypothetical protein
MIAQNRPAAASFQQLNGLGQIFSVTRNVPGTKNTLNALLPENRQCVFNRARSCVNITDEPNFLGHCSGLIVYIKRFKKTFFILN